MTGFFDKGQRLDTPGEESFYAYLGLPLIPPELREGQGEIEAALSSRLPELVRREDLKGLFHVHNHGLGRGLLAPGDGPGRPRRGGFPTWGFRTTPSRPSTPGG